MAENDVYRYHPQQHHCNEGIAVENHRGVLIDTFWGLGDSMGHIVGRHQYLEHLGNLGDYEQIDRHADHPFDDYAPADRLAITSQHGLERALFVRKGADQDHATKVHNARNELEDATHAAEAAQRRVERARQALADLDSESEQTRSESDPVQDAVERQVRELRRAHRMSCSDPSDPTRRTTYGNAADTIEALMGRVRDLEAARGR